MIQTDTIESLRRFNRFYTRRIGLLAERPYGGDFTLTEVRVLFELAHEAALKPSDLVNGLGLDPAYVSRILKRFVGLGLVTREKDPDDGRAAILRLTPHGRDVFAPLSAASAAALSEVIGPLSLPQQAALSEATRKIETLLGDASEKGFTLRSMQVGDLGHITARQALLYAREYGWDISYEALAADLLAGFVRDFDPAKEASFVAVRGDEILGSVFLFKSEDPAVAKLRLLYVEPDARGLGLGQALVGACIKAARDRGYKRLILWTQDILLSARRIYQAAGFTLVSEEKHHSFGHDLNAQVWGLDLL